MLSRLIIIGNGFDLAHGLHTKYSDFMEYLCSYEKSRKLYMVDLFVLIVFRHETKKNIIFMKR